MGVTRGKLVIVFLPAIILTAILVIHVTLLDITVVAVYVDEELKTRYLTWGEGELKLSFNSSITGTPVTLHFKIARGEIKGYMIEADEAMIEYYSMGFLEVSEAMRGYKAESLTFCSIREFEITIAGRELKLRDACVKIEVYSILSLIN